MIRRSVLYAITCTVATLSAVTWSPAQQRLITDPVTGNQVMADEIYVKIRAGYAGADPVQAALKAVRQAGLSPVSCVPIMTEDNGSKGLFAHRIQSMSTQARAQAEAALEDLRRIVRLRFSTGPDPRSAARLLLKLTAIQYAEPVIVQQPLSPPNDSLLAEQTHLVADHVLEAWELWKGDTNMVIGIVDSGIDMFHEDLAPNIRENPGETGTDAKGKDRRTNGVDDDGDGAIDDWRGANLTAADDGSTPGDTKGDGHGTVVAGLAAAATNNRIGVAGSGYLCRFFPVKTAPKTGGALTHAYEGITYCAQRGIKVINCSWGGNTYVQLLQDVITDLIRAYDVTIVGAGGNNRVYDYFYPAGYKGVLGVGALGDDNVLNTTWGEHIDITSPCRYSTLENNTYTPAGAATSFTTPVVTGITALVRSKFPWMTSEQTVTHIRLTADNVDSVNPGKEKLMGYGRINALRAITTEPLSHPGVLLDSVWITDMNNQVKNNFGVGDRGKIHVRLRNVLGPASNIRLTASTYTTPESSSITIDTGAITLASLPGNAAATLSDGIGFQVKAPIGTLVRIRYDLSADAGYRDYYYTRELIFKPFVNVATGNITVSLTNNGHIGYADYPSNAVGSGLYYNGSSFLYEGGFLLASTINRVLDNVRDGTGNVQDTDFVPVEYPSPVNNNTVTLSDAGADATRRIGLELRARIVTDSLIPDAVGILLRTKNLSGSQIDTLRLSMFFDWDIDSTGDGQSVIYATATGSAVSFFGRVGSSSGYYVATGVAGPVTLPVFYAIRNDAAPVNIYDGFSPGEKWTTLSNGIGMASAGPGDISMVIGKRIAGMGDGTEDTTLFVIGCGTSPGNAAKSMQDFATKRLSGVRDETENQRHLFLVGPNPLSQTATLLANPARRGALLRVFDSYGRQVADLTGKLSPSAALPSLIRFDASWLPSGTYFIRLSDGNTDETVHVTVVK